MNLRCPQCGGVVPLETASGGPPPACRSCARAYEWEDGILRLDDGARADDYPESVYALLADAESRHFWFHGRSRVIVDALREACGRLEGRTALDLGCGTGFVLSALEKEGMAACGADMHMTGLRLARRRVRGPLFRMGASAAPFAAQFDAVLLCDVIEHAADDAAVLRSARAAIKPGGAVLVTVPADPRLWTPYDEASGHKRRYTRESLVDAMSRAGLRVEFARYFNCIIYPLMCLQRRWMKRDRADAARDRLEILRRALLVPPAPLNAILGWLSLADIPLSRWPANFGGSLVAVGRGD